jgi:hypothetical protein
VREGFGISDLAINVIYYSKRGIKIYLDKHHIANSIIWISIPDMGYHFERSQEFAQPFLKNAPPYPCTIHDKWACWKDSRIVQTGMYAT